MSQISHPGRRRGAAIAAVTAGVLAVLLLLTTIVTNPLASLVSAAAFAGTVASGWVALTNRDAKRRRAILVGGAFLAVLLATMISDEEHRYFLIVVGVAVVIVVTAARYALGRPPRRPAGDEPVPAATAPALVVNPKSGGGRAEQFGLSAAARERGIRVYEFDGSVPVIELVRQALTDGADALGMAGGDGSLAPAAELAAQEGADFICIPSGTRNHFALDLGLDRSDPLAALDAFGVAHRRRIDLGTVNGIPFLNNVSLGLYGEIVQDDGYRDSKWGTALTRLPDLVTDAEQGLGLAYTDASGVERVDAQVIHVSNNPYTLTPVGLGSRLRLDGGELGVVCLRVDGSRVAEAMARAALGAGDSDAIRSWTTPRFEVRSADPVAAGVDGEALTLDPPVRFESVPASVWVRLPPSAPGESPAARLPGYRETSRELVRRAFLPTARWTTDPAATD